MVCASTTIDVGGNTTCTATHTFTQAELDAGGSPTADSGFLTNNVTASSNEAVDATDELDIPIIQLPDHELVKTFIPNPVGAGETGTFTLVYTNTGNVTLSDININDTVKPILKVESIDPGTADCSASIEQNVACSVASLAPGVSVTIEVTFVAAPLADDLVPDTGQTSGSNYVFYFENGYVLYGSTGDGTATLVDPDGNEVPDGEWSVEGRNQDIFLNTPVGGGPDGGFQLHLSCSEVFLDGWGDSGPIEGEDDGWRILAYEVLRFNVNGLFKDCGQIFAPFEVPNEAEAFATPAGGDLAPNPITDSDTLTIINIAPIEASRERVRKGDVEIQYFNTSYEPVEIDIIRIEWDDPTVLLESAIFQFQNYGDLGISGCRNGIEPEPGMCLLQASIGSPTDPVIIPARSKDWLKLSFDNEGAPGGLTVIIVTDNGATLIHKFGL
jgi:uncharacterized repeat protein (TIGR01451 family)